jgi:tagatose-1,6-bisphosphate aldolase
MRIDIERSGGFAGISQSHSVSTDQLPVEQAETLRQLVDASDFYELPSVIPTAGPERDPFQYKITVESERGTHTVQAGEAAVPPSLQPVLDWVKNSTRKQ